MAYKQFNLNLTFIIIIILSMLHAKCLYPDTKTYDTQDRIKNKHTDLCIPKFSMHAVHVMSSKKFWVTVIFMQC